MKRETGKTPLIVEVCEEHHVSQARRTAAIVAEMADFSRPDVFCIGTSVSELANNLFFHSVHGGKIAISEIERDGNAGIEIVCEDKGPGIYDISLAMRDGYSTSGGLGGGLPGIKRLMDEFEIQSELGKGTRITVRKWNRKNKDGRRFVRSKGSG